MFITNAFSLQMLDVSVAHSVSIVPVSVADVPVADLVSAIGHLDTAAVVSSMLGVELPANRVSVHLESGDTIVVAQLTGGRLPEGSTTLPEGFSISFLLVTVG